jgi:hypothetical protein
MKERYDQMATYTFELNEEQAKLVYDTLRKASRDAFFGNDGWDYSNHCKLESVISIFDKVTSKYPNKGN